jgi:hypothetical protein
MRGLIDAARRQQGTGLGLALTKIIFQERGVVGSRFDLSTIFVSCSQSDQLSSFLEMAELSDDRIIT